MAELADALDLGSSEATRTGSIPASRTSEKKRELLCSLIFLRFIEVLPYFFDIFRRY